MILKGLVYSSSLKFHIVMATSFAADGSTNKGTPFEATNSAGLMTHPFRHFCPFISVPRLPHAPLPIAESLEKEL